MSVVICCYNSEARLPKTLQCLAAQRGGSKVDWELVIVNNNSSDGTAETAIQLWEALEAPWPIRVIEEPASGLAAARRRGVLESLGEFVLFCDDDNYLPECYLSTALEVIQRDERIGVVAGNGEPAWEGDTPQWIQHCLGFLACKPQANVEGDAGVVGFYTAGMILRRQAVLEVYQTFDLSLSGRVGTKQLAAGEDLEICLLLAIRGYQLWGTPRLTFGHGVAVERMTWSYIKALRYSTGTANAKLAPIKFVAKGHETSFKSKWVCQFSATLVRTIFSGIRYPLGTPFALEFWYQFGRLAEFAKGPEKHNLTMGSIVSKRNSFKQSSRVQENS